MDRALFAVAAVVLAAVVAGCMMGATPRAANLISVQEARTMEDNAGRGDLFVLDVRTAQEFAGGHIAGAVNVDYSQGDFRQRLGELETDKAYIVYCKSGQRSLEARKVMAEMGFNTTYSMVGGIDEWAAKGYPVVS